ncbi:hypothetical protein PZA11_006227 [Diplocarpon coronariae]
MDMQHDPYRQRIIQNASSYNVQNGRNATFNQEDPTGWRFAPSGLRQQSVPEAAALSRNYGCAFTGYSSFTRNRDANTAIDGY